jgi:hypothetical protein
MELTQEIVREFLEYEPKTGLLTWKERLRKWFKSDRDWKIWNSNFKGTEAFTHTTPFGYKQGTILRKSYQAHRIIWLWVTGEWPKSVDHKNGIRTDNRWENLRNVSISKNMRNQKKNSKNTSGFRGVYFHKRSGKWVASIKKIHLGIFDTPEEAFEAYVEEAKAYGFTDRHIFGKV